MFKQVNMKEFVWFLFYLGFSDFGGVYLLYIKNRTGKYVLCSSVGCINPLCQNAVKIVTCSLSFTAWLRNIISNALSQANDIGV